MHWNVAVRRIVQMSLPALDAFRRICANDGYVSSREMFPDMAVAVKALTSDPVFVEALAAELDGFEKSHFVRAEYLILILRGFMAPEIGKYWDRWMNTHRLVKASETDNLAFFHGDSAWSRPGSCGCNDEIAKLVGLQAGFDTGKLLQLVRHGIA